MSTYAYTQHKQPKPQQPKPQQPKPQQPKQRRVGARVALRLASAVLSIGVLASVACGPVVVREPVAGLCFDVNGKDRTLIADEELQPALSYESGSDAAMVYWAGGPVALLSVELADESIQASCRDLSNCLTTPVNLNDRSDPNVIWEGKYTDAYVQEDANLYVERIDHQQSCNVLESGRAPVRR